MELMAVDKVYNDIVSLVYFPVSSLDEKEKKCFSLKQRGV